MLSAGQISDRGQVTIKRKYYAAGKLNYRERVKLEWVDWFNHRRLLAPIGNVPPAEYEKMYYDEFNRSCKAA